MDESLVGDFNGDGKTDAVEERGSGLDIEGAMRPGKASNLVAEIDPLGRTTRYEGEGEE